MLQTFFVAAIILLVMDFSAWRYGRDLLRLDRGPQSRMNYGSFLSKRIPIIIAVFAALALVMMESRKSIYLRIALLVVMLIGYVVITLKELKKGDAEE